MAINGELIRRVIKKICNILRRLLNFMITSQTENPLPPTRGCLE